MKNWPFGLLRQRAYQVIYADPPWAYRGYVSEGVPQTTSTQHYDTVPVEDLARMPVQQLAAPSCALFMWAISSHTPQAFWLAEQWGFRFASKAFTWAKLNTLSISKERKVDDPAAWFIGMGHGTRRQTEDCWLFTRGDPPKRVGKGVRELIVSPIREHSRKPTETYDRIEALFDGPYCELFSRNVRKNWDMFGNQVGKYD